MLKFARTIFILALLSGSGLPASAALAHPLTRQIETAAARVSEPDALAVQFEETWNRHDMEAYGQLFHDDADFVNRFGGHYAGRDEIILRHREIHDSIYSDSTLEVDAPEVTPISDDAVILRFYMRLTAGAAHPAGPHQADALMLAVATRKDGVWRMQAAQNTTLIGRDGQPMLRAR